MAAELSRQYDAAKAKTDAPAEPAAKAGTPTPVTGGQGNVTPEGPARGEGGRFAPKEGTKPEAKAPPEPKVEKPAPDAKDAKAEPKTPDEPKAAEKDAKPAIAPHPRWKPEVQERFKGLAEKDPDLAKFVLDQQSVSEKEFTKARQAASQVQQQAEKFKAVEDVLSVGRQARSLHGVDDPTYLRSLVAASDYLAKSPKDGIKMLAEQYGVDLAELANGKGADPGEAHPAIKKLEERVAQQEAYIRQQNEHAVRQRTQGAYQSIESFANAKDEGGQLLYPHFVECIDDITTVVARQLEMGQQPDLKAAYEKAIRLNDAVWMKLKAEESEKERKARADEEAQRIAAAKRAGFSVSGSGGGGDSVAGSIGDELRRQFDKHYR